MNHAQRLLRIVALLWLLAPMGTAHAQIGVGAWVRQIGPATPGALTMNVEVCCNGGRRLTYTIGHSGQVMLIESAFDGREVPVLIGGKPSGETMAITRVDDRHTSTVVKMNGKPFGTSKSAISADGRTLTVESEFAASAGGNAAGKITETWVRK